MKQKEKMNKEEMEEAIKAEQEKTEKRKQEDEQFAKRLDALVELTRLSQEMGLYE